MAWQHEECYNDQLQRPLEERPSADYLIDLARISIAAASFVSTKYIIVDAYFHYPLHLLFFHLMCLLVVAILADVCYKDAPPSLRRPEASIFPTLSILRACALAMSLPFMAQAILHFPNLPTLCMLFVFSDLVKLGITQARCLESSWNSRSSFFLAMSVLTVATSVILFDEYRLEPNGLLFALPGWGLLGLSRGLRPNMQSMHSQRSFHRATSFLCALLTALWLLVQESTTQALSNSYLIPPIVLVFNGITTALTLYHLLYESHENPEMVSRSSRLAIWRLFRSLLWAGLSALLSQFLTRRSISTALQLFAVCLPAIVCMMFELHIVNTVRRHKFRSPLDLVSGATELHSRNSEAGSFSMIHRSRVGNGSEANPFFKGCSSTPFVWLMVLLSAFVWGTYATLIIPGQFKIQHIHDPSTSLDLVYVPAADFDIVVSVYDEPASMITNIATSIGQLPALQQKSIRLWVYTKKENSDLEKLKTLTGAHLVIPLQNLGREGETYLYHIDREWDNLAQHTLFVQAHIHNSWEFYRRIRQYFDSSTGMLSLGFVGNVCRCDDCQDRWGFKDDSKEIVPHVYREATGEKCVEALLSYKGQFIASARRIRGATRGLFQDMHKLIRDPDSKVHRPQYLKGRPDTMDAPFFGYTLERLWSMLLQCSNERIVQLCPSILSGTRRGGSLADCQCLDST